MGLIVEAILAALDFSGKGELTGEHGWLEISQLPGAEAAVRIVLSTRVRYWEYASFFGIPIRFTIQWALYSAVALASIHVWREFRGGPRHNSR